MPFQPTVKVALAQINPTVGDLAGNAFASTCIMAAVIGAFSTVTVGAPPDEQHDLDNVFKAVKTVFDFDSTQAGEGEGTGVKED